MQKDDDDDDEDEMDVDEEKPKKKAVKKDAPAKAKAAPKKAAAKKKKVDEESGEDFGDELAAVDDDGNVFRLEDIGENDEHSACRSGENERTEETRGRCPVQSPVKVK